MEVLSEHLWMLVPGLLVVYLGFDAGGYFAGTTGAAAAVTAVLLAVRLMTMRNLFSGLTAVGGIALVGIAALAGLSIVSQDWSHAPARAILSFDLAALYLLVTGLHTTASQPVDRLRTMIYGLIAGLAIVCGAGLLSRTLPDVFPVSGGFLSSRLSYPVTYWNGMGMLAALGAALCAHISADRDAPPPARLIAAGLIPAFATTLLLTFSRGAIASLGILLILYVLLCPRLSVITAAIAALPTIVAVHVAYDAQLLGSAHPTTHAAVRQGHHVILVLVGCSAASLLLRAALLVAERRVPALTIRRSVWMGGGALILVVLAIAAVVAAPRVSRWASDQYRAFVDSSVSSTRPAATRLASVSNDGRIGLWRVAAKGFDAEPLHGTGAGTYVELWDRDRTSYQAVQDAHSLYLETLSDLGLLGAGALAVFLLALLVGAARRLLIPPLRPTAALATACVLAWCLHSAVDWDWEMPVVMVPVISLAAAVTAAAVTRRRSPGLVTRLTAAVAALAVGVLPALVAVSQAHLDSSVRAFTAGNCRTAIAEARAAHDAVGARPEPLEMIGYCRSREGDSAAAIAAMRAAIHRDPNDWEFHYALAIVTAAAGRNPVPALRIALRLDPLETMTVSAYETFIHRPPRDRRAIAENLPLDVG